MDYSVLSKELVVKSGNVCCFGVVDNIGVPRRSYAGTLSVTFRGVDNFVIRGTCPGNLRSVITHGDPVLIYARITQRNSFPFLMIDQLQCLTMEQKEFVRSELEKCGVGEQLKDFGLEICP